MHRALEIVNAAVALLQANTNLAASVYAHRVLSLAAEELEVPAVSVRMGVDTPSSGSGQSSLSFIDSELELSVDLWAQDVSEQDVLEKLLELRAQTHISLQADFTLGLAYVTDTAYGGSSAPDLDPGGARIAGHISTRWTVRYRMNYTDPN